MASAAAWLAASSLLRAAWTLPCVVAFGGVLGGAGRVPSGIVCDAFVREFPGGISWVFGGGFGSLGVGRDDRACLLAAEEEEEEEGE